MLRVTSASEVTTLWRYTNIFIIIINKWGLRFRSWKAKEFKEWGIEPSSLMEVYACATWHVFR